MLLTRSVGILDDLPRLAGLPRVYAGVSLPTVDEDVRRTFEPRAASIPQRLDVLAALRRAGVRTMAVVQPLLPGPLDALVDALAQHCDSVSLDVLRGEYEAGPAFAQHPRERTETWQRERLEAVSERLHARGVAVWTGELPPELEAPR